METNSQDRPFERYVERYEAWFERNRYTYKSELKAVEKMVPSSKTGVEIGVGSGRFAAPLDIDVGLDPSVNMLKIAQEKGIQTIRGKGESLPLRGRIFDFVLIVTTICFFDDAERALKEAKRVLKRDGTIIIGFVDKESTIGEMYQQKKDENVFYNDATFYSYEEVRSLLEKLDFEDITSVQTLFGELDSLDKVDEVVEGHGEGSFIVLEGRK